MTYDGEPEDFEFDPKQVYALGYGEIPSRGSSHWALINPVSDPSFLILGAQTDNSYEPTAFSVVGNDLFFLEMFGDRAPRAANVLQSVPDRVGPLSDLEAYPPQPNDNDEVLFEACFGAEQMLISPDHRIIYACEDDWFEDGRKVYHGQLDYLGYNGFAVHLGAFPHDFPTPVPGLARVVSIDAPEVVFGSLQDATQVSRDVDDRLGFGVAVRALSGGSFNYATEDGRLWTVDAQGNQGFIADAHRHSAAVGRGTFDDRALDYRDDLYRLHHPADSTLPSVITRCRLHGECEVIDDSVQEHVRTLITAALPDDPSFNPVSHADPSQELSDGLARAQRIEPFHNHEVYISGTLVNPGRDNHGLPAVALYATPWDVVLGFEHPPVAVRMLESEDASDHVLHWFSPQLCYQDGVTGAFWLLVPEYLGRLPSDDPDYYPTVPQDDDVMMSSAECDNPRFSNRCEVICDEDDYFEEAIRVDVGSPPGPASPGTAAVLKVGTGGQIVVHEGQIMPGPVVAARADHQEGGDDEALDEVLNIPDGIRMVVRVQDPDTYQLTNVWELWTFIGSEHERVGTYTVPDEYLAMPLAHPTVAALANDDLYLAFKDETPEDDPDRKGDYIVRVDIEGNVQVSRTGQLAVDFLFTGE